MNELNFDKLAYEWTPAQEKTFTITVRCWETGGVPGVIESKFIWNVYAHIFDTHPLFLEVERAKDLPFHGGCTYDKFITTEPTTPVDQRASYEKTSRCIKVGSDYAHHMDDEFESANPKDGIPWSIRRDIEELFTMLALVQGEQE